MKIWSFEIIKKIKIVKTVLSKWLEISYDGSFGITVVFEKESRGLKNFFKCRKKYLGI